MIVEVGYGNGTQQCEVPDQNLMGILAANDVDISLTGSAEVERALREPIESAPLSQVIKPGETVAIITSDITRPMPTPEVLPAVLDELYRGGIRPQDITLVFGLGSHRTQTEEEQRHLAGERGWNEIRCIDSSTEEFVNLGTTAAGTPVEVNSTVARADRVICMGNIEYHYFAGYSGGVKAIMPGVSTSSAIANNHTMIVDARSCAGNLEDNPVRRDIEEAGAIVGCDFIINVVLDEDKRIIRAFAGNPVTAHRQGCAFLDTLYRIDIPHRADIVIDSQGGAPKDLNLYQTQKALDNAKYAVRKGGVIILVGRCNEGLGNATFQAWMHEAKTPADVLEHLQAAFALGGHKAAAVAKIQLMTDVYLVSDLPEDLARDCFFTPFPTLEEAYAAAVAKMGEKASVLVMPHGGSTVPHALA